MNNNNFKVDDWTPLSEYVNAFNEKNVYGDGVNRVHFLVTEKLVEKVIDPSNILVYDSQKLIRNTGDLKEKIVAGISNRFSTKNRIKEINKGKKALLKAMGLLLLDLFQSKDPKLVDVKSKFLTQLKLEFQAKNIEIDSSQSMEEIVLKYLQMDFKEEEFLNKFF